VARDRTYPVKWESPEGGGTERDLQPTPLNPAEDYLQAKGVALQRFVGPGEAVHTDDESVGLERDDSDRLVLWDSENETPIDLTTLLSGTGGLTESGHQVLRQLIHFIDEGPAEGFATGAYKEVAGGIFPTEIVWWESSSKLKKIVSQSLTWAGIVPSVILWKIYDTDGSTVLAEVQDTISYSGIFETSRARSITVN